MNFHTFVYNQNKIIFPICKYNLIVWNYNSVLNLIENKYTEYLVYYKRLILNKSRENLIKYLLIKEFGGLFININLLKLLTNIDIIYIQECIESKNEMIFWLQNEQKNITFDIFDINDWILNDDIFIIKNNSNSFINHLISKINTNFIPTNEYQNKIYLGNVFLSKELYDFYLSNLNIKIGNKNQWFNNLEKKFTNDKTDKYEKSIYFIELKNKFTFDENYNKSTYPNVPDLINSEKILNPWDIVYKIKIYVENIIILIIFQYRNWVVILILILLITILNYLFKNYITENLNINIKQAQIDSTIFFYPKKFKFFKELQQGWKDIQEEAINIMNNSPRLNISRTINDWHDAKSYIDTIKNKYGWIRSWAYDPDGTVENQTVDGNHEWLNYGLYYFGEEFSENILLCPKTMKLLSKIKSHINICGFSWMFGGCLLQPHTDITGISSGSLAMHLGLSVPKPNNVCRLIIKNSNEEYIYMNEENGKMFIFDATFEHYAYNQSNQDRLILYVDFKTI